LTIIQRDKIKKKFFDIDSKYWWGDDFDVRFLLISRLKEIQKCSVLDLGGGIGIISSEIGKDNLRVNLDISLEELKTCKEKVDNEVHLVCASITNLPFQKNFFDFIICANILEVTKKMDLENNQTKKNNQTIMYPSANNLIKEISVNLNSGGKLFLTTPNNSYYNTTKFTYNELVETISTVFKKYYILFFNTHKKYGKHRKLNFSNVLPKITSKFSNPDKIIKELAKTKSQKNYSVSFFVEADSEKEE